MPCITKGLGGGAGEGPRDSSVLLTRGDAPSLVGKGDGDIRWRDCETIAMPPPRPLPTLSAETLETRYKRQRKNQTYPCTAPRPRPRPATEPF